MPCKVYTTLDSALGVEDDDIFIRGEFGEMRNRERREDNTGLRRLDTLMRKAGVNQCDRPVPDDE
jgi:hypothetical protein